MNRVALIDSGLSNLDSARRAIEECGGSVHVAREPSELSGADRVVLPGVGAFPDAMRRLRASGLAGALVELAREGRTPILGVCLGMQLLAQEGSEIEPSLGLGIIEGEVTELETAPGERIPHIGWNEVNPVGDCPLFAGIPSGSDFYFVHSYRFKPRDPEVQVAITPYAGGFASAVGRELVYGVQFHPEKSQANGFALLRNFLAI